MALTPTQKLAVRKAIASYCTQAETNQQAWHYSQQRPFHFVQNPSVPHVVADCSGYVSMVFHAAMNTTHTFMADPLGMHYSGWGYTGTEYAWLQAHAKHAPEGKWLVGDIVIYGWRTNTVHTSVCRRAGNDSTAIWSSNGNERAPQPTKLHYHPDPVVGVWRPPALQ